MYSWLKICILALVFLNASKSISEELAAPVIEDLRGDILYRGIFDTYWKKLSKDTVLTRTDLIKVQPDSGIDITLTSASEKTLVRIASPIILRLDSGLIRNINSKEYILSSIPKFRSDITRKASQKNVADTITSAFNRLKIISLGAKPPVQRSSGSATGGPSDLATSISEKLEVTFPKKNGVISTTNPNSVIVVWEDLETRKEYDVFVWDLLEGQKKYIGRTSENMYRLKGLGYGKQVVEVLSTDGKYNSGLINYLIEDPRQSIAKARSSAASIGTGAGQTISDVIFEKYFANIFPPKNFVMIDEPSKFKLNFGLSRLDEQTKMLSVEIRKFGGYEYQSYSVEDIMDKNFEAGRYEWRVKAQYAAEPPFYSEPREVSFLDLEKENETASRVSSFLDSNSSSTIMFFK